MDTTIEHLTTTTTDGWALPLRRVTSGEPKHGNPICIVPGYGMNSFILGYHPTGCSMEAYFAKRGFEVWSVDLRGQGDSEGPGGRPDYSLADLALTDLPAILTAISENTKCANPAAHLIGCSLGGTIVFATVGLGASSLAHSVIALGAPLSWVDIHPVLRLAFGSPRVARFMPHRGNRRLASFVFPLALKVPKSLHLYMHPEITDTSNYKVLLKTVADTSPTLNVEIARWIRDVDLRVDGRNVSTAVGAVKLPLLSVVANADGIVPVGSATSAHNRWGGDDKTVITVGDSERRFAHADLFISRYSEELVFEPITRWCEKRSS